MPLLPAVRAANGNVVGFLRSGRPGETGNAIIGGRAVDGKSKGAALLQYRELADISDGKYIAVYLAALWIGPFRSIFQGTLVFRKNLHYLLSADAFADQFPGITGRCVCNLFNRGYTAFAAANQGTKKKGCDRGFHMRSIFKPDTKVPQTVACKRIFLSRPL